MRGKGGKGGVKGVVVVEKGEGVWRKRGVEKGGGV